MPFGPRVLSVGEDIRNASHFGLVVKDCIQAASAVCPPVMSIYYLPVEVQNGLRAGGDVSDVGDLPRQPRRQTLHEGDHHAGAQIQSVGFERRLRSSGYHPTGGRLRSGRLQPTAGSQCEGCQSKRYGFQK